MADISSKLDKIKSAERGEDVRDAIIGALRDINNDVPTDMSNPERVTADMPGGSDLTIPFNPPKLVSEIYVRQAGSGGKSTTLKDITITENGEYPTDEDDYDPSTENRYYKKVKVDVPQLANKIEMDEVVIEQNGTYSATEWGVDGLRTITVNVQAATGDGPFQVEFYDKDISDPTSKVIQTQIVNKNGTAVFDSRAGYPVSPIGQVFMGWNPDPVNVTRNLKCYPRFGDQSVTVGEIPDSWEVICSKGGAGYPIGSFKSLAYGATFKGSELIPYFPNSSIGEDASYIYETIMLMVKVSDGESGSTSSWLGVANTNTLHKSAGDGADSIVLWPPRYDTNDWYTMGDRYLRGFYNGAYFNHMSDIFKQHIMAVTKYTVKKDIVYPTSDKVWIPSVKEIFLDGVTYGEPQGERYQYYDEDILYTKVTNYFTPEEYEAEKNKIPYLRLNTSPVNYCPNKEIRDLLRKLYNGTGQVNLYVRDSSGANGPAARLTDGGWELPRRDPFDHSTYVGFCLI